MNTSLRHSALILLVTFVTGGVLVPTLHRIEHAEEWKEVRVEHASADTHHHHAASDDHGVELLPPCPDPLNAAIACVLCQSVSVGTIGCTEDCACGERSTHAAQGVAGHYGTTPHGLSLVRGPPKQAV